MNNPIAAILKTQRALVIDGALATELERRGCNLNDKLWSAKVLLERPELIKSVHGDYFQAGADCVITASYQATLEGFIRRGFSRREASALIATSVRLARESRDEFWNDHANHANRANRSIPFVAASVGPYGAFLADGSEYRGNYGVSENELIEFHRPRLQILAEAGAEMFAFETLPSLLEARVLLRLLEEFPGLTGWFSFSARDGKHISDGAEFAKCAWILGRHPQVAAIGINCTAPGHVESLIATARSVTNTPILTYPNSGGTYDPSVKEWTSPEGGENFGTMARKWYDAGARLIGGCCQTTPEDIRGIAQWARARKPAAEVKRSARSLELAGA